ncbi:fascin domain-containing protein [Sorangium sp. So ce406]|uniref:fascin domain-containing protein n=1 Tax=Sorangium sp. So ce406 TaxID=3133311 RepID=UPI003F5C6950
MKQRIAAGLPGQLSGVVALKAAVNGRFVCAEDAGNAPLVANRSSAQRWEEFEVVSNSGGAPVPASLSTSYGKNPGKCSGR